MKGDGGEPFVTLREFAQENWRESDGGNPADVEDQLYALTTKGPWTAAQSPLAARWLDAVRNRLDIVVAGSARDRLYFPMMSEGQPATLLKVDYVYLSPMREIANALKARALLRLGAKDFDGFRRDTIALLRLGRLAAQAPTLIQKLVATGCEALALSTVQAAAGSTALTPEQCEQLANDLCDLPAARPLSDCFKYAERFQMLDYLVMCAVHGPVQAARLMSGDGANVKPIDTSGKDWNAALRKVNGWYDRLVEAGGKSTWAERSQAADAVSRDLDKLESKYSGLFRAFMPIEDRMLMILLPSMGRAYQTETRVAVARDEAQIALALRAYQAREGRYPEQLAALTPKYLKAVPMDRFSEQALVYRVEGGTGYVLYSVGPNGKDDGGEEMRAKHDDVAVRGGTAIKAAEK